MALAVATPNQLTLELAEREEEEVHHDINGDVEVVHEVDVVSYITQTSASDLLCQEGSAPESSVKNVMYAVLLLSITAVCHGAMEEAVQGQERSSQGHQHQV